MAELVSIIIPCFNAERWVAKAIQSALDQTWPNKEIIVINDGSTDKSLDIIKSFSNKVRYETGRNCGGNHARNRGVALSKGEYIQFLDADDVLDPRKIERQIPFLLESRCDVVTGDWRHLNELKSGQWAESPLTSPRMSSDIICSLIDDDGWSSPLCYLLHRTWAEQCQWDEDLTCMQDVDYTITLALRGARFIKAPCFCGYYRRPMGFTVSTRNRQQFMNNCYRIYNRVEDHFNETHWTPERRHILIKCYGAVARYFFEHDRTMFEKCLKRLNHFVDPYIPLGPAKLRQLSKLVGYRRAEYFALVFRRAKRFYKMSLA